MGITPQDNPSNKATLDAIVAAIAAFPVLTQTEGTLIEINDNWFNNYAKY